MAYASINGLWIPQCPAGLEMAFPSTLTIDASGEKVAWIFRAPKTGDLAKVRFRTGTVTVGDTLKVSFQDLNTATGQADEVVDQFRTVVVGDGDDNTAFLTGLITSDGTDTGTKRAITKGDLVALVIEFNSFVAGNLQIATTSYLANYVFILGPNYLSHKTAAWAKQGSRGSAFGIEYSDGSYYHIPDSFPITALTSDAINTGTTPDEIGMKFQFPGPVKVDGAWTTMSQNGAADISLVLYDSDGTTELASNTIDEDVTVIPGSVSIAWASFAEQSLVAATNYRLVIKPTTANSVNVQGITVAAAGVLDQLDGGQNFHRTERTNAGAWTDTTTKRPFMGLRLSAIDDGAGVRVGSMFVGQAVNRAGTY